MSNYLNLKNNKDYTALEEPAKIIKRGGTVIFPTETVYGIGANGLDKNAVRKLYNIKKRPLSNPISLLVSDINMVNEIAQNITDLEYKLMEKFFPGPLTIILKKKNVIPDIVTANKDTIGIRMPSEIAARKLIEYSEVPIATPSANVSGKPSGTKLEDIIKDFDGKVDYFIDGGESNIGIASTIIKVNDGIVYILRQGSITKEQIEEVARKVIIERK